VILKDGGIAVVRSGDLLRVQREQNEEDRVAVLKAVWLQEKASLVKGKIKVDL
jgi:hypothetical protein